MVNGVLIPNQLQKCNTSYRLELQITLIPWGGLGSSIAVKNPYSALDMYVSRK